MSEGDHLHLFFTTDDLETNAAEVERNGVSLLKPLSETPWGTKEFAVVGNQEYMLYFGQL